MDELACLMDWDLEAIVRGYNGEAPAATTIGDPHPSFSPFFSQQDELLCSFPEFSETTNVLIDELQELYKPFNPVFHPLSSQTNVTSSLTIPKEVKELQASEKVALQVPIASKYKRSKKNQKKSVVKKVTTVDDGFCDEWAWRKYGQKPIKGSPYPRSYYRCSSSKGCLARKQVERNHLDPKVFLVTYTAEHNHPQPTRRNSLAGSTRKNNINSSAVTHSRRTPLVLVASSNVEDVFVTSRAQQSKGLEKEEDLLEWLDGVGVGDGDAQLGDDWIPSKELEEFIDGCSFTDGTFADI